jgi:hypothetical protein
MQAAATVPATTKAASFPDSLSRDPDGRLSATPCGHAPDPCRVRQRAERCSPTPRADAIAIMPHQPDTIQPASTKAKRTRRAGLCCNSSCSFFLFSRSSGVVCIELPITGGFLSSSSVARMAASCFIPSARRGSPGTGCRSSAGRWASRGLATPISSKATEIRHRGADHENIQVENAGNSDAAARDYRTLGRQRRGENGDAHRHSHDPSARVSCSAPHGRGLPRLCHRRHGKCSR